MPTFEEGMFLQRAKDLRATAAKFEGVAGAIADSAALITSGHETDLSRRMASLVSEAADLATLARALHEIAPKHIETERTRLVADLRSVAEAAKNVRLAMIPIINGASALDRASPVTLTHLDQIGKIRADLAQLYRDIGGDANVAVKS